MQHLMRNFVYKLSGYLVSTCGLLRGKEESGVQPWDAVLGRDQDSAWRRDH